MHSFCDREDMGSRASATLHCQLAPSREGTPDKPKRDRSKEASPFVGDARNRPERLEHPAGRIATRSRGTVHPPLDADPASAGQRHPAPYPPLLPDFLKQRSRRRALRERCASRSTRTMTSPHNLPSGGLPRRPLSEAGGSSSRSDMPQRAAAAVHRSCEAISQTARRSPPGGRAHRTRQKFTGSKSFSHGRRMNEPDESIMPTVDP